MTKSIVPNLPELKFDETKHLYLLNGVEIPSVTTIMGLLSQNEYSHIDERTLSNAASRGTSVHNSIENFLKFGFFDVDPDYQGYMDGFVEWWERDKPELIGSEIRTYHRILNYAGTVDLVVKVGGETVLMDFKTTYKVIEKNCRVQLEAYAQALASHGIAVDKKKILHLKKDGKWDIKEYPAKDGQAWGVFGSLKCIYDYMRS